MKIRSHFFVILMCLFLLLTSPAFASSARQKVIRQSDYGDKWAFTVSNGILSCVNPGDKYPAITFTTDNKTYAINGIAKGLGYPDIDPIWKDNPNTSGLKVNISPFIQRGLSLCSN